MQGAHFPSFAEVTIAIEHAQAIYDFVLRQTPEVAHPRTSPTATP
jgi:hypothetical protein